MKSKNQFVRLFAPFEAVNDTEPVIVDPLDTEAVKKSFDTVSAQKKHWREKAIDPTSGKTYKELYEDTKKAPIPQDPTNPTAKPADTKIEPSPSTPSSDWLFDNIDAISSLTPEERTELRNTAKELNVEPVKFIKSKAGQAQLEKLRGEKKSAAATPSPSNAVPTFKGKPVSEILTDPKSSKEDKQAAYEARMKGVRGANQSV